MLVIFLGGALVLLRENQYPAKIFIGDTFCYYAGAVLALSAIFGTHLSIQDKFQLFVTGFSYLSCSISSTQFLSCSDSSPVPAIVWQNMTSRLTN